MQCPTDKLTYCARRIPGVDLLLGKSQRSHSEGPEHVTLRIAQGQIVTARALSVYAKTFEYNHTAVVKHNWYWVSGKESYETKNSSNYSFTGLLTKRLAYHTTKWRIGVQDLNTSLFSTTLTTTLMLKVQTPPSQETYWISKRTDSLTSISSITQEYIMTKGPRKLINLFKMLFVSSSQVHNTKAIWAQSYRKYLRLMTVVYFAIISSFSNFMKAMNCA